MKNGGQSRTRSEGGFTLFELIVVLAILAGAAALSLPAAERSRRALPARTVALDMASAMKSVRAEAVRSNREQLITVSLAERKYWAQGLVPARALPRGLAVSYEVPVQEQPGEGVANIRFRPDGSSSGGRVKLSGARQSAEVIVDWMTGATRIEWRR